MRYRIDSMSLRGGELVIDGWSFGDSEIIYELKHRDGSPLKADIVRRDRADVMNRYGAPLMCGFTIKAAFDRDDEAWLCLSDGRHKRRVHINGTILSERNEAKKTSLSRLRSMMSMEKLGNAADFLKENGIRAFIIKTKNKLKDTGEDYDYAQWERLVAPSERELEAQRTSWKELSYIYDDGFALSEGRHYPLISIVIPAYNTPKKYLRMLFESFKAQTYPNFEVIVADGSEGDRAVRELTEEYASEDERFFYVSAGGNLGISGNTNKGLMEAKGDYIALCDHDDELPPYALYEVANAIAKQPKGQFFYTDEDKVDFDGKALFEPHFKPDYDPELLLTVNYICHLSVIRRDLLEKVGGFRYEFDGAQDHDFFLRCTEEAERGEAEKIEAARRAILRLKEEKGLSDLGELKLEAGDLSLISKESGLSEASVRALFDGISTSEKIIHIPKVCYHWRYHRGSTASDPKSKLYAFEAGARAIKAHYERGIEAAKAEVCRMELRGSEGSDGKLLSALDCIAETEQRSEKSSTQGAIAGMSAVPSSVEKGVTYGYYHSIFDGAGGADSSSSGQVAENEAGYSSGQTADNMGSTAPAFTEAAVCDASPLISVLIPNKDHTEDLETCIGSIAKKSTYRHIEFIIIENNSEKEETFSYYKKLTERGSIEGMPVRVVYWEREFNYSAINNFGASHAKGDYLLLLNNDVELREPSSIAEMLSYIVRDEIGIVGARLCYPDDTIQHGGVIVGLGGIAGAAFVGQHEKENTYMHRMMCLQDLSAVTAACLLTKREVFEACGGLYEGLAVAFNDIDYCMKVRRLGYRCVYDPYAVFYHYESKSRGLEDSPEKIERFNGEIAVFASRWGGILSEGDPYYNPNLTLRKANFALRDLTKEKPGEPYKLELDVEKQLKIVLAEKKRREKQS